MLLEQCLSLSLSLYLTFGRFWPPNPLDAIVFSYIPILKTVALVLRGFCSQIVNDDDDEGGGELGWMCRAICSGSPRTHTHTKQTHFQNNRFDVSERGSII